MMYYKKCSHILHLIMTLIIWPWVVVWVVCALRVSSHNRLVDHSTNKQMLEELKRLNKEVK